MIAIASSGVQEVRVSGGVVTYLGEYEAYTEYLLERGIVSSASNPGFRGGGLFTMSGRLARHPLREPERDRAAARWRFPWSATASTPRSCCATAGW